MPQNNFANYYISEVNAAVAAGTLEPEELTPPDGRLPRFERAMTNNVMGFTPAEEGGGGEAAAPPAAPAA